MRQRLVTFRSPAQYVVRMAFVFVCAHVLAACSPSPEKLNEYIESGKADKALEKIEAMLSASPDAGEVGGLNLLAAKARMALCATRQCVSVSAVASATVVPELLRPLAQNFTAASSEVGLGEGVSPLTKQGVLQAGLQAMAGVPDQPYALLVMMKALPQNMQKEAEGAVFERIRATARSSNVKQAAEWLDVVAINPDASSAMRHMSAWVSALVNSQQAKAESHRTALRALGRADVSDVAWTLLPHALLAGISDPAQALAQIPLELGPNQLGPLSTPSTTAFVAAELAAIGADKTLQQPWQHGWDEKADGPINLVLMRLSLKMEPNQPDVWKMYLPALVATAQAGGALPEIDESMQAGSLSGPTQAMLAEQLLEAAQKLNERPAMAAPLLQLASQMKLENTQQVALDKMVHSMLIKAAANRDVTATMALASARPAAAANNRQQVVPLLVEHIRNSLRIGRFAQAVSTSILLNEGLGLDVELAPLILEEFATELKKRGMEAELQANTPDMLLKPQAEVEFSLGPIYGFMQEYFKARPEVLAVQLNGLVANARGIYGPATAMYRLQTLFPTAVVSSTKPWLSNAIVAAVLEDAEIDAAELMSLAGQLAQAQPDVPLSSLVEAALNRAQDAEESRKVWAAVTPETFDTLRVLRPQFVALMRGIDAMEKGKMGEAAAAFAELTEPAWREQASAYLQKIYERLAHIAGVYTPLSAAPDIPTALLRLEPQGLQGGALNEVDITWINRLGSLAEKSPQTLVATPAALKSLTIRVPIDLDTGTFKLSPEVLSQTPEAASLYEIYGNYGGLQWKGSSAATSKPLGFAPLIEGITTQGKTFGFMRALANPAEDLKPDGTYLITTHVGHHVTETPTGTATIMPEGSILTLATGNALQPTPMLENGLLEKPAQASYALTGSLKHPSSKNIIALSGFFDPSTQASYFSFTYLLPESGQPVKAMVKCQAVAGPITCGAHHQHSPRLVYASVVRGQQTRESMAEQAAKRAQQNEKAIEILLKHALSYMPKVPEAVISTSMGAPAARADLISSSVGVGLLGSSTAVVSKSDIKADTQAKEEEDLLLENEGPSEEVTAKPLFRANSSSPTTVVVRPGDSTTVVAPGVFIHRTNAAPATVSESALPSSTVTR